MRSFTLLTVLALVAVPGSSSAQSQLYRSGAFFPATSSASRVAVDQGVAVVNGSEVHLIDALTGQELHGLDPQGITFGEAYGAAIAIGNGYAAVGGPVWDNPNSEEAVYVFDAQTGVQIHRLTCPDPTPFQWFGGSLAIHSGRLLVGAERWSTSRGRAYLFDLASGAHLATLESPTPLPYLSTGCRVELHGDLAAVAANGNHSANPPLAGAVYLFDVPSGQLIDTITVPVSTGPAFGFEMTMSPPYIATYSQDPSVFNSGQVWVHDTSTGALLYQLTSPVLVLNDTFGRALDSRGTRLIVGGPTHIGVGHAYVFDLPTGALEYDLQPNNGGSQDFFGSGVAIQNDLAIVGAPGNGFGAAFGFSLEQLGSPACFQAANSTGHPALLSVAGSDSLGDQDLRLRASSIPGGQAGIFFAGASLTQVPLGGGTRCVGGSLLRISPAVVEQAGELLHAVDFQGAGAQLSIGTLHVQTWYRDPAGAGTHLSSMVSLTLLP